MASTLQTTAHVLFLPKTSKTCVMMLSVEPNIISRKEETSDFRKHSHSYLLCADEHSVHKQTDATILQHPRLVEDETHVAPLTLLCQFRTPEPHGRVVQDRSLMQVGATLW